MIFATVGAEGKNGCTLKIAETKFKEDWNRSIDDIRKQLNFKSNLALLQACSDRIVIIKEEQYMLYPIEDETTEHQMGLINDTKEKKKAQYGSKHRDGIVTRRGRPFPTQSRGFISKRRGFMSHGGHVNRFNHSTGSGPVLNDFGDPITGSSNQRHKVLRDGETSARGAHHDFSTAYCELNHPATNNFYDYEDGIGFDTHYYDHALPETSDEAWARIQRGYDDSLEAEDKQVDKDRYENPVEKTKSTLLDKPPGFCLPVSHENEHTEPCLDVYASAYTGVYSAPGKTTMVNQQRSFESDNWSNKEEHYDVPNLHPVSSKNLYSSRNSPTSSGSEQASNRNSSLRNTMENSYHQISTKLNEIITEKVSQAGDQLTETCSFSSDLNIKTGDSTYKSLSDEAVTSKPTSSVNQTSTPSPINNSNFTVNILIQWLQEADGSMLFDDIKKKFFDTYDEALSQPKLNHILGVQAKNTAAAFQQYNPKIFQPKFTVTSKVRIYYNPNGEKIEEPSTSSNVPVANPLPKIIKKESKPRTSWKESSPIKTETRSYFNEPISPPHQKIKPDIPLVSNTYRELPAENFAKPVSAPKPSTSKASFSYREVPERSVQDPIPILEDRNVPGKRRMGIEEKAKNLVQIAMEVYSLAQEKELSVSDAIKSLSFTFEPMNVADIVGNLLVFFEDSFYFKFESIADVRIKSSDKKPNSEVKRIIDSMENSRIKDYLYPNSLIKDESIREVKFIRFDSPDVPFVLHLKDHLEQLSEMKEILSSIEPLITCEFPEPAFGYLGECCLYTGHETIKRCRIVRPKDGRRFFLVDCVDTGERLTASISDLRALPASLFQYPAFAILAELADYEKLLKDKKMNDLDYFNEKVPEAFEKLRSANYSINAYFKKRTEDDGRYIFKVQLVIRGENPRPTPFYPYFFN
uniref:Tudor domain-containing protein n=1 Tax=Acrobeloides nanus TaxID=290746 RepID=A0A914CUI7_9BILA